MKFSNRNKKYDAEAKLLTDIYNKNKQNLDLLNYRCTTTGATVGDDKAKLDKVYQEGTIAFMMPKSKVKTTTK
jgi:hypothetical protein